MHVDRAGCHVRAAIAATISSHICRPLPRTRRHAACFGLGNFHRRLSRRRRALWFRRQFGREYGARSGGGTGGGGSGRGGNSGGGCGGAGSGFWAMPLLCSVVSMGANRSPHSTRPPGLFSHCIRVRSSTFALSHGVASGLTPSQATRKLAPWTTVLGIDRVIVLTGDLSTRRGALSLLTAACPIDMATIEHAGRT